MYLNAFFHTWFPLFKLVLYHLMIVFDFPSLRYDYFCCYFYSLPFLMYMTKKPVNSNVLYEVIMHI